MLDERAADERGIFERKVDGLAFSQIGGLGRLEAAPGVARAIDQLFPAAHRLRPVGDLRIADASSFTSVKL